MVKYVCCICLLLAGCHQTSTTESSPRGDTTLTIPDNQSSSADVDTMQSEWSIVPGVRLGKVSIGMPAEGLGAILPPPDLSDAAMGKAWQTWYGEKVNGQRASELNIYTAYKDTSLTGKTVQLIRSTSSSFTTADNLAVSIYLDQISRVYPGLAYRGHFKKQKTDSIISLYEAPGKGIAFEIKVVNDKKQCSAIIIYDSLKTLFPVYTMFLNVNGWQKVNQQ